MFLWVKYYLFKIQIVKETKLEICNKVIIYRRYDLTKYREQN